MFLLFQPALLWKKSLNIFTVGLHRYFTITSEPIRFFKVPLRSREARALTMSHVTLSLCSTRDACHLTLILIWIGYSVSFNLLIFWFKNVLF
jgi:hypothetical protein